MQWLEAFPAMAPEQLSALKKYIDQGFRALTREYGEAIERFFDPLKAFLIASERLLTQSPWWAVLVAMALLVLVSTRSLKLVLGTVVTMLLIGYFGMWEDTMKTVSMIFVCTVVALAVGLPIGILTSRSNGLQRLVIPLLDVMQTMPSFVYLIPVVMFLGIGKVPGLIAVVIYALPPVIRFTNLGIRLVSAELMEATEAFGASNWQKIWQVQLPLALPTIMGGVNQTIMLSLSMVVVASMIGVQGLGQPVLKAISNQYFTLGLFNGIAIVGIAIIFDRASQAYGKRLQRHSEVHHG
ncbi:MAG: proline/glycine betaine ABC transporter permease [Betaproteobacteria bacterium]|nr:proline/glycine betaine ABC transporter permease [Betaproteobacteria bacterium]NCP56057.1 proline/glycine betaine ABC transporter permease [Rhodoferax sp.]NCP83184.1 proline/glycine betaine ABC transporter permease [Rhodoferax sp.]PIW06744.1 MAG: ABC transporter permease [Comamonadaceae bacterium CG17_big_fil_post_rev_8_21_14_2_50_60_13]PJC13043.1 MAG: ABC transporter permease [Comamonadaceae bacterium CG_4_9_14_0_8_um_filter_60_18]